MKIQLPALPIAALKSSLQRGGVLKVTLVGDRVRLAGQAVTVLRGELLV
jgi:hypothetical protein